MQWPEITKERPETAIQIQSLKYYLYLALEVDCNKRHSLCLLKTYSLLEGTGIK